MEMLNIYTRNLELTERLRTYVERKVARFERYLPSLDNIRVDLSESNARDINRRMVAQITIYVPKAILRADVSPCGALQRLSKDGTPWTSHY